MKFKLFFKRYFFTVVLCALGLVLSILFLTIGFWPTLLIFFLTVGFAVLGFWLDNKPTVRDIIDLLFSKNTDDLL